MDILKSITRLPDSKPLYVMEPISKSGSTNVSFENFNISRNNVNIKSPNDFVNIENTKPVINREGLITGLVVASVIAITILITINHIKKTKNEKHGNP